jgi:three-Cys-motif partner protein
MAKQKARRRSGNSSAQIFGGPWTLLKTEIVERYLKFFVTALKAKPFRLVYVDAFAGSGAFRYVPSTDQAQLTFGGAEDLEHPGSAQRALSLQPPFDEVHFIESRASNVKALQALIRKSAHATASIERGDANEALVKICDPLLWTQRRGVVFLDPFGMEVSWETLKLIANTRALDLWFLFPLAGTARCLPLDAAKLDQSKRSAMTRTLGTDQWYNAFYRPVENKTRQLWEEHAINVSDARKQGVDQIESFVEGRLKTIFADVAPPKRLKGPKNRQLFSLFFAISNPSDTAIRLARKGADHILGS